MTLTNIHNYYISIQINTVTFRGVLAKISKNLVCPALNYTRFISPICKSQMNHWHYSITKGLNHNLDAQLCDFNVGGLANSRGL